MFYIHLTSLYNIAVQWTSPDGAVIQYSFISASENVETIPSSINQEFDVITTIGHTIPVRNLVVGSIS